MHPPVNYHPTLHPTAKKEEKELKQNKHTNKSRGGSRGKRIETKQTYKQIKGGKQGVWWGWGFGGWWEKEREEKKEKKTAQLNMFMLQKPTGRSLYSYSRGVNIFDHDLKRHLHHIVTVQSTVHPDDTVDGAHGEGFLQQQQTQMPHHRSDAESDSAQPLWVKSEQKQVMTTIQSSSVCSSHKVRWGVDGLCCCTDSNTDAHS